MSFSGREASYFKVVTLRGLKKGKNFLINTMA